MKLKSMAKNVLMKISILVIIAILSIENLAYAEASNATTLQEQQTQVQGAQQFATTQLEGVKEELTSNLQQIADLNANITQYEGEITTYNSQIVELQNSITTSESKLKTAQDIYDKNKKLLDDRLVTMYEAGNTDYLDVIFSSKSITEFLSNYYLVSVLANYNFDFLEAIDKQKKAIETEQSKLQEQKNQINNAKQEKEKASIILQNTKVQKDTYLSQLTDQEKQIQTQIDTYQAQLNLIESEIHSATQSSLAINPNYVGGIMLWPLPGYTKITSTFGMRTHPVTGVYKLHTGVDIGGAPVGTPFVAANDGVVIKSQYNAAYGNMVLIDHGGGISTLYAHGSKLMVSVGQQVKRGDTVLLVGATGYATGPHAHFEVRVNGSPVNPMPYITNQNGSTQSPGQ